MITRFLGENSFLMVRCYSNADAVVSISHQMLVEEGGVKLVLAFVLVIDTSNTPQFVIWKQYIKDNRYTCMKVSKEDVEEMKLWVIEAHNIIINVSGGHKGIRGEGGLEHAIDRILSFDDKKKKAAKLAAKAYTLFATRHYFTDGNKRTAHIVAKVLLLLFGRMHLKIHYRDAVKYILEIASEKRNADDIMKWIFDNSDAIQGNDISKHLEDCEEDISEMNEFMKDNFS